jgi:hypothetical protein
VTDGGAEVQQIPTIEIRVKQFGEQLAGMIALRHEEIEQYVDEGVKRAMAGLGEQLITDVAQLATAQVVAEIKQYFTWGPGREAIREAVAQALEPVAARLRGEA